MGITDKEYIAIVINYFWGEGTATSQSVNERVVLVVYEALEQAKICSDSMDLVPRPTYGTSSIKMIIIQLAGIGRRIKSGNAKVYNSCRGQVGVNYKSKIKMALMGI